MAPLSGAVATVAGVEITQADVDHALVLARQYRRRQAPRADREDCEGAALEGLVQAAKRYRPEVGDFWAFATRRVIGSIRDDLRRLDHLSRHQRSHVVRTADDRQEWDDPAAFAHASPDRPLALERRRNEQDEDDERGFDPGDLDPGYAHFELSATLDDALADLSDRERFIVTSVDLEGFTEESIGELLGVTGGRISQIRTRALLRLRKALSDDPRARVAPSRA